MHNRLEQGAAALRPGFVVWGRLTTELRGGKLHAHLRHAGLHRGRVPLLHTGLHTHTRLHAHTRLHTHTRLHAHTRLHTNTRLHAHTRLLHTHPHPGLLHPHHAGLLHAHHAWLLHAHAHPHAGLLHHPRLLHPHPHTHTSHLLGRRCLDRGAALRVQRVQIDHRLGLLRRAERVGAEGVHAGRTLRPALRLRHPRGRDGRRRARARPEGIKVNLGRRGRRRHRW